MMKHIRLVALGFAGLMLLGGAGYSLYLTATLTEITARESALLSVLLFILSVLATWFFSHIYGLLVSRASLEEKIDTIAVQSSEKIMNLSTQLWRLEQFASSAVDDAHDEEDGARVALLLENRLFAISHLARSIRSSNNTFLSDWKGVVSPAVKQEIENQAKSQADIINAYAEIDEARAGRSALTDELAITPRIEAALKRIEEQKAQLPAAVTPDRPATVAPAVAAVQHSENATDRKAEGTIDLHVLRPVYTVTGSGRFIPELAQVMGIWVELISSPDPSIEIAVRAGSGTTFDFNVHLKSMKYGVRLPPGLYQVRYRTFERPAPTAATDNEGALPQ